MNPPPDRSCASSPHVFVLSPSSHPRPPIMWWAVNQPTNIATIEIVPRSPHPPAGPVCGCTCPGGRIDLEITTGDVVRGYTAAPRNSLSVEPLLLGRLVSHLGQRVLAPPRASDTRTVTSGQHST